MMRLKTLIILVISVTLFGAAKTAFAADLQDQSTHFNSALFHYQSSSNSSFLEVTLEGEKWIARTAKATDIDFLNRLFLDKDIMKYYGAGPSLDAEDVFNRTLKLWLPRFEAGEPHGGLIIWDKEEGIPVGFVMGGLTNKLGVAGLSYAYLPSIWGKGIGSDVVKKFVEQWGQEVRRIGLDTSKASQSLSSSFCCYKGEALAQFEAVVSPDNLSSIKILLRNNFQNWPTSAVPLLDLSGLGRDDNQSIEESILNLISLKGVTLTRGQYYKLIDFEGEERTFSMPESYARIRYHLSYQL